MWANIGQKYNAIFFQFEVEVNERRDLLFFFGADLMPTVMNPKKLEFATW